MIRKSHFVYPLGKPIIPHLLRCQGFAVKYYSCTLDALYLGHPRLSLNRCKLPHGPDALFGDMNGRGLVIGGKIDQVPIRDPFIERVLCPKLSVSNFGNGLFPLF